MKRFSAAILLLVFAFFFIETVKLPEHCQKQTESKCDMMMKMHANCKMRAEMVKTHKQKKGKCNPKICAGCPVCSLTISRGMISFSIPKSMNKIAYSVMLNNKLSDYHSPQWKPPDVSFV